MKLFNPFEVLVMENSGILYLSIWVLIIAALIGFGFLVATYPVFTIPVIISLAGARVIYAMMKGK